MNDPPQHGLDHHPRAVPFSKFLKGDRFTTGVRVRFGERMEHLVDRVEQGTAYSSLVVVALGQPDEVVNKNINIRKRKAGFWEGRVSLFWDQELEGVRVFGDGTWGRSWARRCRRSSVLRGGGLEVLVTAGVNLMGQIIEMVLLGLQWRMRQCQQQFPWLSRMPEG